MSVKFKCICGKNYKASAEKCGQLFACRQCNQRIQIPLSRSTPPPVPRPNVTTYRKSTPSISSTADYRAQKATESFARACANFASILQVEITLSLIAMLGLFSTAFRKGTGSLALIFVGIFLVLVAARILVGFQKFIPFWAPVFIAISIISVLGRIIFCLQIPSVLFVIFGLFLGTLLDTCLLVTASVAWGSWFDKRTAMRLHLRKLDA